VLGHAEEHGPEAGRLVRLGAHSNYFLLISKRGFGSREREQSAAAVIGEVSDWEWLGCELLYFMRREGESPRRQGWCAEHDFNASRQVGDNVGHVGDGIFQAVEGLVNEVIRVAHPRMYRMSVWCPGEVEEGGMGVCC